MEINKLVMLGMFLVSISLTSAFGVATPYWDDNPLRLAPGESMDVKLTLQNMAGDVGDATLAAEIINDGDGIARIKDASQEYFVPYGTDDVVMNVMVGVPGDVQRGGIRDIVIEFSQVDSEDAGMVSVSGGFTTKFPVYVVAPTESVLFEPEPEEEMPAKKSYLWVWIVVLLFVLAVVAWFIWERNGK